MALLRGQAAHIGMGFYDVFGDGVRVQVMGRMSFGIEVSCFELYGVCYSVSFECG